MATAEEMLQILGGASTEAAPQSAQPSGGIQSKLDILSGKTKVEASAPKKEAPIEDMGAVDAATRKAVGMMTFGLDKPFNAAMMAGITDPIAHALTGDEKYGGEFGDRYDRRMKLQKLEDEAASQNHPIASGVGNVLGFAGSMGAAVPKAIMKGGEVIAPTLFEVAKQNAKFGSTIGGLNALGYAEGDAGDRVSQGITGAVGGGAFGAAIPPALMTKTGRMITIPTAGAAGGYLLGEDSKSTGIGLAAGVAALKSPAMLKTLYNNITQSKSERIQNAALKKIAQAFGRDNVTVDEARTLLSSMDENGVLADVGGENVLGLGRSIVGVPGEGKEAVTKFLNTRQQDQSGRVQSSVEKGLGTSKNFYEAEEELIKQQREKAGPLYTDAFKANQTIESPLINRLLRTEAGKEALGIARKTMSDKQKFMSAVDPELTDQAATMGVKPKGGVGKGLKLETLDQVKKALDTMYKTMSQSDSAAIRSRADGIKDLKNALLKALDEADTTATRDASGKITKPGLYKQARSSWSDDEGMKESLQLGKNFILEDADISRRQLSAMSESEREMFKIGAIKALRTKIENTPYGSDAVKNIFGSPNQLFGSPAKRERLMAIFPSKEAFGKFEQEMLNEAKMYATRAKTLQGSRTAPMLAEIDDSSLLPVGLEQAAKGNFVSAAKDIGLKFLEKYQMSPEVRGFIGQKLFSSNPAENAETIKILQQLEQAAQPTAQQGMQMPSLAGQAGRSGGLFLTQ